MPWRVLLARRRSYFIRLLNLLFRAVVSLLHTLDLVAVGLPDVRSNVACLQLVDIPFDHLLFVLVDLLHGCLQQTSGEPRHVANRAVHEELLDDLLVREDLAEPDAQFDVALQCFADDSNEEGDLSSHTCPECHSQGESDDIFEHFQLVALSTSLEDNL